MHAAILHDDFEDLTRFVLEQAIVGQDYGGAASGLERAEDVLDEVELFVAGLDGEVVAVGRLIRAFRAEGRIVAMTRLRLTGLLKRGVACAKMSASRPPASRSLRRMSA